MSPESDKFIFVDEFDSGAGVSLKVNDLEEPALISMLSQFEIPAVTSLLFSGNTSIPIEDALSFAHALTSILFDGMISYNLPPFRAFVKALMLHLCQVLKTAEGNTENAAFEQLFLSCFNRFANDMKFAFAAHWVDLPYEKLSHENRCRIFCRIGGCPSLPSTDLLNAAFIVAENLFHLALHDTAYLLNVCIAVASTNFEQNHEFKRLLLENTTACVLAVCHLSPNASDVLWKISRPKFIPFLEENPRLINCLIDFIQKRLLGCDKHSIPVRSWLELSDLFKSINYSKFEPNENSWSVIRLWLVKAELTSGEYMVAKDVLSNLSWTGRAAGLPSFLNQTHHHRAAILLLEWSSRANIPAGDKKCAWSVMLRLNLITRNPSQSDYSVEQTNQYVKNGEPMACYAALLMSPAINASIEAFAKQGIPLVRVILDKAYPNEAIHGLLLVLADHYSRSAFEFLIGCKDFIDLVDRILTCSMVDMIKGWAFESLLPKDVLAYGIVGHMRSMNSYIVLEFWLCVLGKCSEGFQKPSVMDAIEILLSLTPAVPDGLQSLSNVYAKHYFEFVESARKHVSPVRAFVSWIVGLPFSIIQSTNQSSRWPWFCLASLCHDLQNEFESGFHLRFTENFLSSPNQSLEKTYKIAIQAVEDHFPNKQDPTAKQTLSLLPNSFENVTILRLANYCANQINDLQHPATPLAWLVFFRGYLRKPTWSTRSMGYQFLQNASTSKKFSQLLSQISQRLRTNIEELAPLCASSPLFKECHLLYRAMLLWLEEPKLHSEGFDPSTLPPTYLPDIVATLIDPQANPWPSHTLQIWLTSFVDLPVINEKIQDFAGKFKASIDNSVVNQVLGEASVEELPVPGQEETSAELITDYVPLPNIQQFSMKPVFAEITPNQCKDVKSSLQIAKISLEHFKVYSQWVSEQQSLMAVAYEKMLDTLPNLYNYENVEERITKPCQTITSYLKPCTSPAVLVARYRKPKLVSSQESAMNRNVAQAHDACKALTSLLTPTASQAPVEIAVAAIRLESLISKIATSEGMLVL